MIEIAFTLAAQFIKALSKSPSVETYEAAIQQWSDEKVITTYTGRLLDGLDELVFTDGSSMRSKVNGQKICEIQEGEVELFAERFAKTISSARNKTDSSVDAFVKRNAPNIRSIAYKGDEKILIVFNDASLLILQGPDLYVMAASDYAAVLLQAHPFEDTEASPIARDPLPN